MVNVRPLYLLLAVAAVFAVLSAAGPVGAQSDDPPVVTYQNPEDGDVLGDAPFVLQMCFEEPINTKDLDKGGDFAFSLVSDAGLGYGMRIVFQPDGYGVAIYPGGQPSSAAVQPTGEARPWVFEYRVTDNDSLEPTEGEITFTVDEDADPIPRETPPPCAALGPTPGPIASQETPRVTRTPGETEEPADGSPDASPDEGEGPVEEEDDDDDPDILPLALLTVGVAGALAGLAVIGYLIRRRIGHDPHRSSGDGPPGH